MQLSLEKTIEHALGTKMISEKQGERIVRQMQTKLLPILGVVPTFPLNMRWVPFTFSGLGIHHPYHERGRQQLEALLQYQGEASQTSRLLEDTLEQAQLQVGCEGEFWIKPFKIWGRMLTRCWIRELWEFTDRHRIKIRRAALGQARKQCVGDRSLNELAAEYYDCYDKRMRINCVQIHLGVYRLSDIVTSDGVKVEPYYLKGCKDPYWRSGYVW